VRRLVIRLSEAMRWLTGTGAVVNARFEVDRAAKSVTDLDTQLRLVSSPSPRRAA